MSAPVTVLIPAYNAAATLARALDSVMAQTVRPEAILVVDDGSGDSTAAIAAAHPAGARVIRHAGNRGSSAALTTALEAAGTDLVAFLDADDEWLPGKLAAQTAALSAEASLVATGFVFVGADGREVWTYGEEPAAREGVAFWKTLLEHSMIAKPTVLTRRSAIVRVGGFDPALAVAEDQDLWIRLAHDGPVRYLAQPMVRVHDAPASLMKRQSSPDRDFVLPMVERYLVRFAGELSRAEVRQIRARRYGAAARNMVGAGRALDAVGYARVAVANGATSGPLVAAVGKAVLRGVARMGGSTASRTQ